MRTKGSRPKAPPPPPPPCELMAKATSINFHLRLKGFLYFSSSWLESPGYFGTGGEISCAAAFRIAGNLAVDPEEVGFTMDSLELKIAKCQMGLFGYRPQKCIVEPAERVEQPLEAAIRKALIDGRLPCIAAWEIAESLKVSKMAVASACESQRIKISACQLGAF